MLRHQLVILNDNDITKTMNFSKEEYHNMIINFALTYHRLTIHLTLEKDVKEDANAQLQIFPETNPYVK